MEKLNPLESFQQFKTITDKSFITTARTDILTSRTAIACNGFNIAMCLTPTFNEKKNPEIQDKEILFNTAND